MAQRLIDANALKKRLCEARDASMKKRKYGWEFEYDGWNGAILQTGCEAVENSVDAEPVRHGKWIGYAGTIGNECSVCGKWLDVLQGTAEMNYCPNCGARMDEE